MVVRFRAKFDGKVLVPQEPIDLTANGVYEVAVENGTASPVPGIPAQSAANLADTDLTDIPADVPYPLVEIHKLATDMGVTDLAERHHHYAHLRAEGE
jgi:hypothetical protein